MIALKIIIYFLLGAAGVGLPTLRTIKVIEGSFVQVFFIAVLASLNFVVFTILVVERDLLFIIPNTLGASISVTYLAYKRRKKE